MGFTMLSLYFLQSAFASRLSIVTPANRETASESVSSSNYVLIGAMDCRGPQNQRLQKQDFGDSTFDECQSLCDHDTICEGFRFNTRTFNCKLYSEPPFTVKDSELGNGGCYRKRCTYIVSGFIHQQQLNGEYGLGNFFVNGDATYAKVGSPTYVARSIEGSWIFNGNFPSFSIGDASNGQAALEFDGTPFTSTGGVFQASEFDGSDWAPATISVTAQCGDVQQANPTTETCFDFPPTPYTLYDGCCMAELEPLSNGEQVVTVRNLCTDQLLTDYTLETSDGPFPIESSILALQEEVSITVQMKQRFTKFTCSFEEISFEGEFHPASHQHRSLRGITEDATRALMTWVLKKDPTLSLDANCDNTRNYMKDAVEAGLKSARDAGVKHFTDNLCYYAILGPATLGCYLASAAVENVAAVNPATVSVCSGWTTSLTSWGCSQLMQHGTRNFGKDIIKQVTDTSVHNLFGGCPYTGKGKSHSSIVQPVRPVSPRHGIECAMGNGGEFASLIHRMSFSECEFLFLESQDSEVTGFRYNPRDEACQLVKNQRFPENPSADPSDMSTMVEDLQDLKDSIDALPDNIDFRKKDKKKEIREFFSWYTCQKNETAFDHAEEEGMFDYSPLNEWVQITEAPCSVNDMLRPDIPGIFDIRAYDGYYRWHWSGFSHFINSGFDLYGQMTNGVMKFYLDQDPLYDPNDIQSFEFIVGTFEYDGVTWLRAESSNANNLFFEDVVLVARAESTEGDLSWMLSEDSCLYEQVCKDCKCSKNTRSSEEGLSLEECMAKAQEDPHLYVSFHENEGDCVLSDSSSCETPYGTTAPWSLWRRICGVTSEMPEVSFELLGAGACANENGDYPQFQFGRESSPSAETCFEACKNHEWDCTGFDTRPGCMLYFNEEVTQNKQTVYEENNSCYKIITTKDPAHLTTWHKVHNEIPVERCTGICGRYEAPYARVTLDGDCTCMSCPTEADVQWPSVTFQSFPKSVAGTTTIYSREYQCDKAWTQSKPFANYTRDRDSFPDENTFADECLQFCKTKAGDSMEFFRQVSGGFDTGYTCSCYSDCELSISEDGKKPSLLHDLKNRVSHWKRFTKPLPSVRFDGHCQHSNEWEVRMRLLTTSLVDTCHQMCLNESFERCLAFSFDSSTDADNCRLHYGPGDYDAGDYTSDTTCYVIEA